MNIENKNLTVIGYGKERANIVPKRYRAQVHDELSEVWSSNSWEQAKRRLEEMVERWSGVFKGFSDFISEEGLETLTVYKVCPEEHRKKLRTNNIIERVNQEFKRRGRVVRIFPSPESCKRLYSAIAKEWDEDWMTGKRYMDMEPLWDWERNRGANEEELTPLHSKESKATEKLAVVD